MGVLSAGKIKPKSTYISIEVGGVILGWSGRRRGPESHCSCGPLCYCRSCCRRPLRKCGSAQPFFLNRIAQPAAEVLITNGHQTPSKPTRTYITPKHSVKYTLLWPVTLQTVLGTVLEQYVCTCSYACTSSHVVMTQCENWTHSKGWSSMQCSCS